MARERRIVSPPIVSVRLVSRRVNSMACRAVRAYANSAQQPAAGRDVRRKEKERKGEKTRRTVRANTRRPRNWIPAARWNARMLRGRVIQYRRRARPLAGDCTRLCNIVVTICLFTMYKVASRARRGDKTWCNSRILNSMSSLVAFEFLSRPFLCVPLPPYPLPSSLSFSSHTSRTRRVLPQEIGEQSVHVHTKAYPTDRCVVRWRAPSLLYIYTKLSFWFVVTVFLGWMDIFKTLKIKFPH